MSDDELILVEEPFFCCLLPLTLRLTGRGCDTPACGALKNPRVACRVQKRTKITHGLFAVTLLIQLTGTFQGQRVRGARCITLKLPFADKETQVTCRILPRSLQSACVCHADGTECEASLALQLCVVAPCPDIDLCRENWSNGACTDQTKRKIKRIIRPPLKPAHCPECEEIKRACPPIHN